MTKKSPLKRLRSDFGFASGAAAADMAQLSVNTVIDAIAVLWVQHREYLIGLLDEAYQSAEVEKVAALAATLDLMVGEDDGTRESVGWEHEPAAGESGASGSELAR